MKTLEEVPHAVSVAEYKRSVHLLPEDNLDDVLFGEYLREAQAVVETASRRPMTPRNVRFQARLVGATRWWLPVCPIISLTAITYTGADGAEVVIDPADMRLELQDDEPQLVFDPVVWAEAPAGAVVTVTARVGYEVGAAPDQLRRAMILIVKDWYDSTVAVDKSEYTAISFGCKSLIRQVRYAPPAQMISELS